jgi:hypothetical protein
METVDDETGQAKSIVEIYEKSGKIYGKWRFLMLNTKDLCKNCSGEDANKPILI